jgi:hypothetical protein
MFAAVSNLKSCFIFRVEEYFKQAESKGGNLAVSCIVYSSVRYSEASVSLYLITLRHSASHRTLTGNYYYYYYYYNYCHYYNYYYKYYYCCYYYCYYYYYVDVCEKYSITVNY